MPSFPVQSTFSEIIFTPVRAEACNSSLVAPGNAFWKSYDTSACSLGSVSTVYDDSLYRGWSVVGSKHDLGSTTYLHTGASSISWDVIPTAQLNFSFSGVADTDLFYGFEFWVFGGGRGGQDLTAQLILPGGIYSRSVNISQFISHGIQEWAWNRAVLPFTAFVDTTNFTTINVTCSNTTSFTTTNLNATINELTKFNFSCLASSTHDHVTISSVKARVVGLTFKVNGHTNQGTIYLDDLRLIQKYPVCENDTFFVYDDKLENGFIDWSWGSAHNLSSDSIIYSGQHAISWEMYNHNGIKFHTAAPIDPHKWQALSMYLNYQQIDGWDIVLSVTSNDKQLGTIGLLNYYGMTHSCAIPCTTTRQLIYYTGGSFPQGIWVRLVIPLYAFGANAYTPLDGVQIVSNTDKYQGKLLIDEIAFIRGPYDAPHIAASASCLNNNLAILLIVSLVISVMA